MSVVNLEDPDCLPAALRRELKRCDRYFASSRNLESIQHEPAVANVIDRVNEYCQGNLLVGYHYTRAIREDIESMGLQLRTGSEIRKSLLRRFGHHFSPEQRGQIKEAWAKFYTVQMQQARDHRIWFNFTRHALEDSGAELLLKFYGGEQVYFYIYKLHGVDKVLASIGEPFVVRCTLVPAEVQTFIEKPWGQIAVSSYHRKVNSEANQVDQDGYQLSAVPACRIELLALER